MRCPHRATSRPAGEFAPPPRLEQPLISRRSSEATTELWLRSGKHSVETAGQTLSCIHAPCPLPSRYCQYLKGNAVSHTYCAPPLAKIIVGLCLVLVFPFPQYFLRVITRSL